MGGSPRRPRRSPPPAPAAGGTGDEHARPTASPADQTPAAEPAAGDLLAAFRDGDAAAFQQIVGAFQHRLVSFFYRLCWDRDRAEDFAQDLFLKLLRGSRHYRPEGKLATFVFRVATNLWIDHYRSTRPQPRMFSLDQVLVEGELPLAMQAPSGGTSPFQNAVEGEERARLRRAVESLTEPHRLVFELAVFQQMPYAEIADVLAIPVGTVKSRMHNSVQALKGLLGQSSAGDRTFRLAGGAG